MRIGINALFLRKPGTGIGQVTWHFLRTLATHPDASKHQFFIYSETEARDAWWPKNFHSRAVLPWWKRDDDLRRFLFESRALPEAVAIDHCDVLLSLYQSASVLQNIPHCMLVHDVIPHIFPEYTKAFRKQFFWKRAVAGMMAADTLVAVSEHTKKDILTIVGSDQGIRVAYPSIDPLYRSEVTLPEKARIALKYQLPEKFLYHGGGLEVRKNTELVLVGYQKLSRILSAKELPKLVISGTLHSEKNSLATPLMRRIQELGLEDSVRVLGFVPSEDLPALYALATVFLYPSRYEGFGLPVLEAMSMGTPVITTRVASIPEVGSEAVLYVHPDDSDALARLLKKILHDEDLLRERALAGRTIAARFEWETFTNTLFSEVLVCTKKK